MPSLIQVLTKGIIMSKSSFYSLVRGSLLLTGSIALLNTSVRSQCTINLATYRNLSDTEEVYVTWDYQTGGIFFGDVTIEFDAGTGFQLATDAGTGRDTGNPLVTHSGEYLSWDWNTTADLPDIHYDVVLRVTMQNLFFGGSTQVCEITIPAVVNSGIEPTTFGTSCGLQTPAAIDYVLMPVAGKAFGLLGRHVPRSQPGVLIIGDSNTSYRGVPLPIDLSPYGFVGCWLLVNDFAFLPVVSPQSGTVYYPVTMPDDDALGTTYYWQFAFMVDEPPFLEMTDGLMTVTQ